MKQRISELDYRTAETDAWTKKEKNIKKKQYTWDMVKRPNIHVTGIPEEKKENRTEMIPKKNIDKDFFN